MVHLRGCYISQGGGGWSVLTFQGAEIWHVLQSFFNAVVVPIEHTQSLQCNDRHEN